MNMMEEPTEEEIRGAKIMEKDAIKHYEEDKKEFRFSFVDYAKEEKIELWRLLGAFTEMYDKFPKLKETGEVPLTEADKIFLKWGLYKIIDIELGRLRREKLLKKLREAMT